MLGDLHVLSFIAYGTVRILMLCFPQSSDGELHYARNMVSVRRLSLSYNSELRSYRSRTRFPQKCPRTYRTVCPPGVLNLTQHTYGNGDATSRT